MARSDFSLDQPASGTGARKRLPTIVLVVLLVAISGALIAVSVLLGQKTTDLNELQNSVKTTSAPSTSTPLYRLPKSIIPSHYELFLQVSLPYDDEDPIDDPFTTKGSHVAITLSTSENNVNRIKLHARHTVPSGSLIGYVERFEKEQVTLTRVAGEDGNSIAVESVEFLPADIVVVQLSGALDVGENYVLRIEFGGVLGDDNEGIYRSRYIKDGKTRSVAILLIFKWIKLKT